jgi:hypothetical protein
LHACCAAVSDELPEALDDPALALGVPICSLRASFTCPCTHDLKASLPGLFCLPQLVCAASTSGVALLRQPSREPNAALNCAAVFACTASQAVFALAPAFAPAALPICSLRESCTCPCTQDFKASLPGLFCLPQLVCAASTSGVALLRQPSREPNAALNCAAAFACTASQAGFALADFVPAALVPDVPLPLPRSNWKLPFVPPASVIVPCAENVIAPFTPEPVKVPPPVAPAYFPVPPVIVELPVVLTDMLSFARQPDAVDVAVS